MKLPLLEYCEANKHDDTDWVVLPAANFDYYDGNADFGKNGSAKFPTLYRREK